MNETPAGVNYGFVLDAGDMDTAELDGLMRLWPIGGLYGNVVPAGGGGTTTESPRDMGKANEQAVDRVVEYLAGKKGALHPRHIDMVESAVQKARRDQAVGRAIARAAFRHSAGLDPAP